MDLFHRPSSAPSRAVRMTAMALGVPLELRELHGDQQHLRPQYSIPTLKDHGLVLWESHTIQMYLVDRYRSTPEDEELYPREAARRALVNQRLFFDACVLYHGFVEYYEEQVFDGLGGDGRKLESLKDAVKMVDLFLEGQPYVTGQAMTIVDLSMLATVATMAALGFDLRPYQNVSEWYKHMKDVAPGSDLNEEGAREFAKIKSI
uniref:glutathione transferase n=1 Tax=Culex pipiens TaxID=7175 RepID=A0A8D8BDE2_CULPI